MQKPSSLQAILRRRQQAGFVGREEEIRQFRHNLILDSNDDQRRFIFNIFGQGGVGKSSLARQFSQLAEQSSAITAWTDEHEEDVPAVMARLVEQLSSKHEHLFKNFNERYRVYRQRRQELEADPEAPQNLPAFIGRTLARTGIQLGRGVPVAGAVLTCIDEDALAAQAGELTTYIARKLTNKDEVHLVQKPVDVLTPLFLEGLQKLSEKSSIALFLDTYERTEDYLDAWLINLLEGHYGEMSANIVLTIAGRDELDSNLWSAYRDLIARISIEPFSEQEARLYLERKGIADQRVIDVILHLSGRLPLLVATLAAESPQDPDQIGDPSGTAVDRFLKWVETPLQRQLVLNAALPRLLNRDVLAELIDADDVDALFSWLKQMPFMKKHIGGWQYHEVVRTQMLRYKQQESPQEWNALQGQLIQYYEKLRGPLKLTDEQTRGDFQWQNYMLEILYHRLCQQPDKRLPAELSIFVSSLFSHKTLYHRWGDTIQQAGEDINSSELQQWGQKLTEGVKAFEDGQYTATAKMLSALLSDGGLNSGARIRALDLRGHCSLWSDDYPQALADLTEVINARPKRFLALASRGWAYYKSERYEEALTDLTNALALKPDYILAITRQAAIFAAMDQPDKTLANLTRALELAVGDNKETVHILQHRGNSYIYLKLYTEAIADFNRALDLAPTNLNLLFERAHAYMHMQSYEEAEKDYSQVLQLDSNNVEALINRADLYRLTFRHEEALQDLSQVLQIEPDNISALVDRGHLYRITDRYDEALKDLDHALQFEPENSGILTERGWTYQLMGYYDKALLDLNRAIDYDPDNARAFLQRGAVYRLLGNYDAAFKDIEDAMALDTNFIHPGQKERGLIFTALQQYQDAVDAFKSSLNVDPFCGECWTSLLKTCEAFMPRASIPQLICAFPLPVDKQEKALMYRAKAFRRQSYYEEALADFTTSLQLNPARLDALLSRAVLYRDRGRYEEALADFTTFIQRDPTHTDALMDRAMLYRNMRRYEDALKDLEQVIALDKTNLDEIGDWYGLFLTYLGRYSEAIEVYSQLPDTHFSHVYNIAVAMCRWKGLPAARSQLILAERTLHAVTDPDMQGSVLYGLGGLAALKGNTEQALDYLRRAVQRDESAITWARHDVAWLDLRSNPRFLQMIS